MKKILRWELVGILPIVLVGTSLHFVFAWTNYWRPAALIAAVNESTWEHFKMGFWPGLIFALIEYRFIRDVAKNFIAAKFAGLLSMPVVTMVLFYGYTAITGQHHLLADIFIFIASVTVGQLVSYKIMTREEMGAGVRRVALVGLAAMVVAFSLLSYFPRHNFLFRHPEFEAYGILESYEAHDHNEDEHHDEHEDDEHHDE